MKKNAHKAFLKGLLFALLFALPGFEAFSVGSGVVDMVQSLAMQSGDSNPSSVAESSHSSTFGAGGGIYLAYEGKDTIHFGAMPLVSLKSGIFKDVLSVGIGAELVSVYGGGNRMNIYFDMKVRDEIMFRIVEASFQNQYSDVYIGVSGEYKILAKSPDPTVFSVSLSTRTESTRNPYYLTGDLGLSFFNDNKVCLFAGVGVGASF